MMLVREKKRHRQDCGPFAYDQLPKGRSMKKRAKTLKETASYCSPTEPPWSADVRDAFGITGGCRIEIGNRGLGGGDSERGNVFGLCNLELFQDYVTFFYEQGETSGIAWSTLSQSQE